MGHDDSRQIRAKRLKKIIGVALVIADESARGWVGSKFARQAVGNFVFIVILSLAAYTIALAGKDSGGATKSVTAGNAILEMHTAWIHPEEMFSCHGGRFSGRDTLGTRFG